MASPALLLLALFVAVPFVAAIWFSLHNVRLGDPRAPSFMGITQYVRILTDPDVSRQFIDALLHNLIFAAVVVPVQTALALSLALLVKKSIPGVGIFRSLYFLPVVFPIALVAIIWRLILARGDQGLLNSALSFFSGGAFGSQDWLGSELTALASVIVLSIWQGCGFQMVILLAALQQVPAELYEAAELDRASAWQRFVHVTVPGIKPTLVFVALYTMILSLRVFDQIYVLAKSGGGLNEGATRTVMYEAVTAAFDENNIGRASAISVVFFVIVVILSVIQRRATSEKES
ncbi:sugar ABC transporter permease [Mycetocola manganoxydans]|uniref:Sugar ABC transporter permease n=1 Tax=Mycetocola manganoxydans TaxID=699879 RepID=A0A3L6ZZB6_9MICO|nr:sugar ABC transporter permease [Mycetocola manganoxydans]RLP73386.1 sugar ABC transporter permease [Mycetocola manganoxydans]GHD42009.1 sugar ABC transporter permease [Mycetocola manganoxydans]